MNCFIFDPKSRSIAKEYRFFPLEVFFFYFFFYFGKNAIIILKPPAAEISGANIETKKKKKTKRYNQNGIQCDKTKCVSKDKSATYQLAYASKGIAF